MTAPQPAVFVSHPPAAVLRVVNPVMKFLLRTPLMGGARKGMMVLGFTGRKSGKPYSVLVSAHQTDDGLYAIAGAPWRLNFRGGAAVDVMHDGNSMTMRGELIEDPATVGDLAHRVAQAYGVKGAQRTMGLKFRDARIPTADEFAEAAQANHLGAIRLTPAT